MKFLIDGISEDKFDFLIEKLNDEELISKVSKIDYSLIVNSSLSFKELKDKVEKLYGEKIILYSEFHMYLGGLNCANCTAKIENEVRNLEYVKSASFDFATERFSLFIDNKKSDDLIFKEVKSIADRIEPGLNITKSKEMDLEEEDNKFELVKLALILVALIVTVNLNIDLSLKAVIFLVLYLVAGFKVIKTALLNILKGDIFDENFLMTLASLGAIFVGEFPEAVSVMLFYSIGEYLQDRAVESSRKSISSVLELKPEYANLFVNGKMKKVSPEKVSLGDIIVINPGERVPLDGIVLEGSSFIDKSAITGESVPVMVNAGDEIVSGAVNSDGLLKVKTTQDFENTTISKILDLVQNASSRKSKTEKFISKFSKIYTPIVVGLAVLIATVPSLLGVLEFKEALFRACTFLVISCPCALVISVPLGVFAGIGSASRSGIFVKGGNYLESLSSLDTLVFDKTGTITKGKFAVGNIVAFDGYLEDEIMQFAYNAEKHSTHPIAKAIISYKKYEDVPVDSLTEVAGRGISYIYEGKRVLVGNEKLLLENNIDVKDFKVSGVGVYVSLDNKHIGTIDVSDELKDNIKSDIEELVSNGIKVHLLSGDKRENVEKVANEVGIENYSYELLPEEKLTELEKILDNSSSMVAFVGDGVNDAPSLKRADIGIAMGSAGSDSAIEAADVVLLTDEISKISKGIEISKRTKRIVYQNIIFALGVKFLILILGAFGLSSMWAAVFADVGVSLIAVLNSMRALK